MDIYEKIYDVANSNLNMVEQKLPFGKNVFKNILYHNPHVVDIHEFDKLCNEDLLVNVYLRLLNRLPDTVIIKIWQRRSKKQSHDEILNRYYLLYAIVKSDEYKCANKNFNWKNLRNKVVRASIKNRIGVYLYELYVIIARLGITIIRPVWRKLPKRLKKRLKNILLKWYNLRERREK